MDDGTGACKGMCTTDCVVYNFQFMNDMRIMECN